MADVGRVPCPSCGCPDQQVLLACGFCGAFVHPPDGREAAYTAEAAKEAEELIGYRGFVITRNPARVNSPVFRMVWTPGGDDGAGWYTAECNRLNIDGVYAAHLSTAPLIENQPPVVGCGGHPQAHGCGFYLSRTWGHALENGYHGYSEENPRALAKCQIAGKVIAAQNGWRAQFVKILTLYVPHELWKLGAELKQEYGPHGVEIDVRATMVMPGRGQDGAILWCQRCSAKMPRRSQTCTHCGHTHR